MIPSILQSFILNHICDKYHSSEDLGRTRQVVAVRSGWVVPRHVRGHSAQGCDPACCPARLVIVINGAPCSYAKQVTAVSGDSILIYRLRALAAAAARPGALDSRQEAEKQNESGDRAKCDGQPVEGNTLSEKELLAKWAAGEDEEQEEQEVAVAEDGWLAVGGPADESHGAGWVCPAIQTRNGVIYKIDRVLTPGILVTRMHDLD